MTDSIASLPSSDDAEIEKILQYMLDLDEDITARGVIRRHSKLKAASSITRAQSRAELLKRYQEKQNELRNWQSRLTRKSKDAIAHDMAVRDLRIAALEKQVELLTASHVAMIRAVGELGGYAKWAKFFQDYQSVRDTLNVMGAMPSAEILPISGEA